MGDIPRIRDFNDPAFNPFIADELAFGDTLDPYAMLANLRRLGPVHEGDYRVMLGLHADLTLAHLRHFTVVGCDEIGQILNDPATFSNKGYAFNIGISFGRSISTMDAPEHARYRRIFQKAFLPNIVAKWGDVLVDPVVHELMSAFVPRGAADLIQEFTLYYPFNIIYRQLALPAGLRLRRTPLCEDAPIVDEPVLVAIPEETAPSHVMSPKHLPREYQVRFASVIADVATTGN